MWAVRCVHEASLHDANCCVTLTYDEDHLPEHGNLVYRDFQLFLKRLRKFVAPVKVRFFCGGEYGDRSSRPHFHALLFGYCFPDLVVHSSRDGVARLWTSVIADRLWQNGNVVVGECTFESAAYIARYLLGKQYGVAGQSNYWNVVPETGEIVFERDREFAHMSLRPGIGADWIRLYWRDCLRAGGVVSRGQVVPLPRSYSRYMSGLDDFVVLKQRMRADAQKLWRDNTPRRLKDKARVAAARLGLSRRVL
ncbi:MAG: replication initiator protein [Microviridae sp.]|nr:MAG: replication initiator protein [Microviridae sp.]